MNPFLTLTLGAIYALSFLVVYWFYCVEWSIDGEEFPQTGRITRPIAQFIFSIAPWLPIVNTWAAAILVSLVLFGHTQRPVPKRT